MNGNRKIVLQDGRELYGKSFGAERDTVCELVFNTSMVGYQEIVSDPSYTDQLVVMTYPVIGNYGITDEDYETKIPTIGGLAVRDYNDIPSNFRYTETLSEILNEYNIPAISGIDTRMLTRIIRDEGSQRAFLTAAECPLEEALAVLRADRPRTDAVSRVSCKKKWYSRTANPRYNVVAIDCGIKHNIIRHLNRRGCNVTIVPYDTRPEEILALRPDGLFISNGPGNPEDAAPFRLQKFIRILGMPLPQKRFTFLHIVRVERLIFPASRILLIECVEMIALLLQLLACEGFQLLAQVDIVCAVAVFLQTGVGKRIRKPLRRFLCEAAQHKRQPIMLKDASGCQNCFLEIFRSA